MSDKPKKLTAKERRRKQIGAFHDALIGAQTMEEACKIAGISARTGSRWIRSDVFSEIYSQRRQATLESAASLLRAASIGSIEALSRIVRDKDAPATATVQAAGRILDLLLRITELSEIERSLQELEAAAAEPML